MENILRANSTPDAEKLLWQRRAGCEEAKQKRLVLVRGARLSANGVPMSEVFARTGLVHKEINKIFPAAKRDIDPSELPLEEYELQRCGHTGALNVV